jgi:hypothetical protein
MISIINDLNIISLYLSNDKDWWLTKRKEAKIKAVIKLLKSI